MKIIRLLLITAFIIFGYYANAQPNEKMQKIKSLKIGFITESLELTPDEASDFWPIYNFHQDKIHQLYHQNRKLRHAMRSEQYFENLTDEEADKVLNNLLQTDKNIEQEKLAMFEKLKTVLPSKKLLKLHKAENDFRHKILEQYRKRKEGTKK